MSAYSRGLVEGQRRTMAFPATDASCGTSSCAHLQSPLLQEPLMKSKQTSLPSLVRGSGLSGISLCRLYSRKSGRSAPWPNLHLSPCRQVPLAKNAQRIFFFSSGGRCFDPSPPALALVSASVPDPSVPDASAAYLAFLGDRGGRSRRGLAACLGAGWMTFAEPSPSQPALVSARAAPCPDAASVALIAWACALACSPSL